MERMHIKRLTYRGDIHTFVSAGCIRLTNKVAPITGAAGGIGAAIARRFACEGALAFIANVRAAEGEAVAAEPSAG
jgi:FlaA1/EpsC-like NDP-sugar epimerase